MSVWIAFAGVGTGSVVQRHVPLPQLNWALVRGSRLLVDKFCDQNIDSMFDLQAL